ncbi:glycosyl transferase [[Phormidium ambiguum] IAM M-71]|uniref:Glycosyl transferase n=1 Tax=[Phormidium ambiguum] IAM M-71 TaxID=454136 RepID=A0A1U7I8T3_9CYAN|nr:glycosyltransferase [Phormidium ambiguum]OKH32833.1 glycosyl transferase [Phormidium ambiguum IAM M-71]
MTNPNISVSFFLPNLDGGGAERAMLHLAAGMAKRGIKTDLILANAKGEYLEKVPPEVRLINLNSRPPVILWKTLALRRYLQQEKPTYLLSALDILSAATWAKKLADVPTKVIMCVQTNLSQQFKNDTGIMSKIRPLLVKQWYPLADGTIAASQGVAEDVSQISGIPVKNINVIYNPVVMPELFDKAKEPINHPWFASGELPVILGVGRLVPQKDFPTLIKAFAIVRKQISTKLVILGEGEKRPQLETLIRELGVEKDVDLPGFKDNPYTYMAKAKLFVLSSAWEGFGNVVAEAMAVGTPVVSTNCPSGPAEILENGKYGQLVSVGDFEGLANAILETLKNPTNSQLLQERALDFTVDNVVDQYLKVLGVESEKSYQLSGNLL